MVLSLVKINLRAMFSSAFNRSRRKKKLNPALVVLIVLLAVYCLAAVFFTIGMMFYNLCGVFFEFGIGWFYFTMAGLMIFALCIVGSFFMVQTQLFAAKDNELLLSMPIKPPAILAGRLTALLVFEYAFEALIMLPVFVVLIITGHLSAVPAVGIVLFFLAGIFLPMLALSVGCLFGWIVALVTARMRRKNIVTFIMTAAFLIVYFWLYSKMTTYMNVLIERGAEFAEAVKKAIFPAYHYGLAAAEGNFLSFLIFIICAVVPFAVMYVLLSRSFIKVATSNRGAKKAVYREKPLKTSGVGTALVKKEIGRFFSNPMYILNAAMGSLFTFAGAAVLLVKPDIIIKALAPLSGIIPGFTTGIIGAMVLTMLCGLNLVSAPTVSLEGNKLWIIKSLPVPSRTILLSKLCPHMICCGLPAILTGVICIFRLPANGALEAALIILSPLALTVFTGIGGLLLNLVFPRFDWINEIQPVKQGMSSLLTMFGAMAFVTALGLLYGFALRSVLTPQIYLLLCAALFLLLSAVLYFVLITAGVRRFDSLDA